MASEHSCFIERLRVLLVDENPVCLKITARMLNHCNYHVVGMSKATDALETVEKNPKYFDLMITDVYDNIEILSLLAGIKHISGDLPVVLISSGTEVDISTLTNSILHGASEVISKPVALTKVNTLRQHVYRRRLMLKKRGRPQTGSSSSSILNSGDVVDVDGGDVVDVDGSDDHPRKKKIRVRWQGELHEKFTDAVHLLGGLDKAKPMKILELMNVPDVSKESVNSHLQKCRKKKKPLTDHTDVSQSSLHVTLPSHSAPPLPPLLHCPIIPQFSAPPLASLSDNGWIDDDDVFADLLRLVFDDWLD